jgi:hypothetical protein
MVTFLLSHSLVEPIFLNIYDFYISKLPFKQIITVKLERLMSNRFLLPPLTQDLFITENKIKQSSYAFQIFSYTNLALLQQKCAV